MKVKGKESKRLMRVRQYKTSQQKIDGHTASHIVSHTVSYTGSHTVSHTANPAISHTVSHIVRSGFANAVDRRTHVIPDYCS